MTKVSVPSSSNTILSPVSGTVAAVNRGEKRKVLNVTVAADAQPAYEEFARLEPAKASREEIVELNLKALKAGYEVAKSRQ